MERELDDTIIKPPRPQELVDQDDDSDTFIRARRATAPRAVDDAVSPEASAVACYSFIVGSHQPIDLDRPAYLGRRPNPPRIAAGGKPRLVRVPSPLGEVSGTHLELRQEGAMVIATDLKSTNGTRVRLPGSAPIRLRQGESIVVTPGSLIEIGDGNVIEIQPLRRIYPSDRHLGATH